jgi:flagellar assembly protein FliH
MSSFEPLLPSLLESLGFMPLGVPPVAVAPVGPASSTPFTDLNPPPPPNPEEESQRLAAERAALEQAAHARGVAEGRARAQEELITLVHGLGEAIHEVGRFRRDMLERYQSELLDLALEVARKVVDRELEQHPEHWLQLIRDGVKRALDRDHIRIRVAGPLFHFLREHTAELRVELDGVKDFELLEDPALPATGCVVETSYGDLDLGVDSQIATIRGALGEPA